MDWEFDESLKMTYDNPVFLELKKRRKEEIKDEGWVRQYKLDDPDGGISNTDEEEKEDTTPDFIKNALSDEEDLFNNKKEETPEPPKVSERITPPIRPNRDISDRPKIQFNVDTKPVEPSIVIPTTAPEVSENPQPKGFKLNFPKAESTDTSSTEKPKTPFKF